MSMPAILRGFRCMPLPGGWKSTSPSWSAESGQARVYKVQRSDLGGKFALKRLKNPARRDRFIREVKEMRRLRDAGVESIPEIVESDLEDDRPWFVMPWCENGSLEDRVESSGFVADPVAGVRMLAAVADALARIHAHCVAHRDLKPANVLLDGQRVLVADFGLCLALDEAPTRLTDRAEAVGSRWYIAPENESGMDESLDQRPADFYAFGKLLWALLAGRQPRAREQQLATPWTLAEVTDNPRFSLLQSLQESLLENDPRKRLSDWDEVVRTLRAFESVIDERAPTVRDSLGAASVGGRIYAIGGQAFPNGELATVEMYDHADNSWSESSPMPTPRLQLGVAGGGDGLIYAVGGTASAQHTAILEVLSPTIGEWQERASMPMAVSDMAIAALADGRILVTGGLATEPMITDAVAAYDPQADSWAELAPLPLPRRGHAATTGTDGRVYVIGGRLGPGGAENTPTLDVYDPAADYWEARTPMPTARAWLAAVTAPNGKIWTMGGYAEGFGDRGYLRTVEIYDPATDTWTARERMVVGRANFAAAAVGNQAFLVGGAVNRLTVFEVVSLG